MNLNINLKPKTKFVDNIDNGENIDDGDNIDKERYIGEK
jgi:hypothetical protein